MVVITYCDDVYHRTGYRVLVGGGLWAHIL